MKASDEVIESIADKLVGHVLSNLDRSYPHICFGPVVYCEDLRWHFLVYSGVAGATGGFRCNPIWLPDKDDIKRIRAAALIILTRQEPCLILRDFDDELELTGWSGAIWPCEKTRRLHAAYKKRRAACTD